MLACLALAAGAFLLLARDGDVAEAEAEAEAERTATTAGRAVLERATPRAPQSRDRGAPAAPEASAEAGEPARRSVTSRGVPGRIVWPPGTPADEAVRLVVLFRDGDGATATLEPDAAGRFEVDFPAGEEHAEVGVLARYLFLTERVEFERTTPELAPELGACAEGRVNVPAGHEDLFIDWELVIAVQSPSVEDTPWRANAERPRGERDGSFQIGGLPTGWLQRLIVRSPHAPSTDSESFVPRAGETLRLEWDWSVGATLAGRVVDERGVAVERALLRVSTERLEAVSASDGSFELRGVPSESFQLTAWALAHAPAVLRVESIGEAARRDGVELVLARGLEVRLHVRYPDGAPVSQPSFELEPGELAYLLRTVGAPGLGVTMPSDGELVLSGVPPIPFAFTLRARPPGAGTTAPAWTTSARVDPMRERKLDLVVRPEGRSVIGRVLRANGEPAHTAWLSAACLAARLEDSGNSRLESARATPPNGEFELRLPRAGRWLLHAADETTAAEPVVVDTERETAPLELRLAPRARVAGRVLAPDGTPVRGATLEGIAGAHRSRDGGSFDLPAAVGAIELHAEAAGYAASEPVRLELGPDEVRAGVELRLRRGGSVTGRVANAQWLALDPVFVSAWTLTPEGPGDAREVTVDAEGRFRFDALLPATWAFAVRVSDERRRPDGAPQLQPFARVEVRDGGTHELELGASATAIEVLVRIGRNGRPFAGAAVTVCANDDGTSDVVEGTTDAAGRFAFIAPQPGEYTLQIARDGDQGEWCHTLRAPLQARFEVELDLGGGALAGRLLANGSLELAGTEIEVLHVERGDCARTRAAADGNFRFDGLQPGEYRVLVGDPYPHFTGAGVAPSGVGRATRSGIVVRDGATTMLEVSVVGATTVFGSAWSRTRRDRPSFDVYDAAGNALLATAASPAPDGGFRLDGLPLGRLRFEFRYEGEPAPAAVLDLDVTTSPFGPLDVQLD